MQIEHVTKPVKLRRWVVVLLAAAMCLKAGMVQANEQINLGFSRSIVGGVNENDALAVIKVWATELMVSENYFVNVRPKIYGDAGEMKTALQQNLVDFICFNTNEFFDFAHLLDQEKFVFPVYEGSMTEGYLLVIRKNSPIETLEDLKGRSLIFSKNARTALSFIWLDVELARAGLPVTEHFFNRVKPAGKVSDALLPIFFGKEDACLVTRRGFGIMAELNPQISHQLKFLAASKGYIPGFLAFRKNYRSKIKEVILNRIGLWGQTFAGHQILTIFQTDGLVPKPSGVLGPTMALIKEHRHLFSHGNKLSRPAFKAKADAPSERK
ncbi:MAG: phosphate/phosphite/phosphonate ABC transporter substrate-binding protein [Desulfobacterales bacterium]|nr:phosphate/phosphite/phosphonate ABC transporter substrate-binding protein [Desulfobacterales bacterium]